jgi:hypothetical protein
MGGGEIFHMNNKLTIAVALAAGLAGGMLAHFISPPSVFAQSPPAAQAPTPAADEVRAKNFVLVDQNNNAVGTFTVEPPSDHPLALGIGSGPHIVLRNAHGGVIWRFNGTGLY